MPMIDIYAPSNLFPAQSLRKLGKELILALLEAEGVKFPTPFHLANTAAFIHEMDGATLQTGAEDVARVVRIQVVTPPEALSREGQKQLVQRATEIVVDVSGDTSLNRNTWVILTEAAEGGWGIAGTAFGREEFTELAEQAKRAS